MSNIIKIKAGSGLPTTSDIVDREMAFDRANNKLYINDSGTIVQLTGSGGSSAGSADEADAITFVAQAGETLSKGNVVYISGLSGNTPIVSKADADDSSKMPAYGIAATDASLNNSVTIVTSGTLENFDTSAFSQGNVLYVNTTAGTLTQSAPAGESSLIQNIAFVVRSHASTGAIKVDGAGRTAATPNLNQDKIFLGNSSNQAVSTALSSVNLTKFNNDLWSGSANQLLTDNGDGTATSEANLTFNASNVLTATDGSESMAYTPSNNYLTIHETGATKGSHLRLATDNSDFILSAGGSVNQLSLYDVNGVANRLIVTNAGKFQFQQDVSVPATNKIYLDGTAGQTYITESTNDVMDFYAGSVLMLRMEESGTDYVQVFDNTRLSVGDGKDLQFYHSGNINYIRTITQDQDLHINVNDGGTTKTALAIDSSENALITTHGNLTVGGQINLQDTNAIIYRNSGQLELITYGGYNIDLNPAGDVRIDGASLKFNSNAEYIYMKDSASASPRMFGMNSSNNTYIGPIDSYAGGSILYGASSNVADHIFYTSGSERLRIKATTGNVGIGTNSPTQKLQVAATATNSIKNALHLSNNLTDTTSAVGNGVAVTMGKDDGSYSTKIATVYEGNNPSYLQPALAFYTMYNTSASGSETEKMRISAAGNVGIGTSSPSAKLDVRGNVNFFSSDASDYVSFTHSDNGIIINSAGSTSNKMTLNTGGTTALTIDASQNVGIGTASPAQKLHIVGGNARIDGDIITQPTYKLYLDGGLDTYITEVSANIIGFNTAGAERARIDSSGRLLVGTTATGFDGDADMAIFGTGSGSRGITIYSGSTSFSQINFADSNSGAGRYTGVLRYNHSNNAMSFHTNDGLEAMRIDSSGNVGIGTSSPGYKLDVVGTSRTDALIIDGGGTYAAGSIYSDSNWGMLFRAKQASPSLAEFRWANSADSELMRIDSSGNVGIGTTSPATKLEVKSTIPVLTLTDDQNKSWTSSDTTMGKLSFKTSDSSGIGAHETAFISVEANLASSTTPNGELVFGTSLTNAAATEKMRIDDSGNVGIGTTSPGYKLSVENELNVFSSGDTASPKVEGHLLRVTDTTNDNPDIEHFFVENHGLAYGMRWLYDGGANTFSLFRHNNSASGNEVLRFNRDNSNVYIPGNVGIGTTSPSFKLKVNVDNGTYTDWETIAGFQSKRGADTEYEAGIMINSLGDALGGQISSNWYWSDNTGAKGNTGRSAGVFGISNSASNESEFYWQTTAYNNTTLTTQMILDNGQNLHVDGDVVAYSTSVSDKRLKDNIKTIDNALDKVMALRGVEFDWNATSRSGQHDIGLIAQEVEEVIPEVVREKKLQTGEFTDNEKTFKTIDYDKMVGVLVEAIKEQQQQINELKEKLNG